MQVQDQINRMGAHEMWAGRVVKDDQMYVQDVSCLLAKCNRARQC
jgi:hypothetical protein